MLFNSMTFLVFFVVVTTVYFALPWRVRWLFLLVASYYFYMSWKPEYATLILTTTAVNYLCALRMPSTTSARKKKALLVISLCTSLGMLFAFKYFNFFNDSLRIALAHFSVSFDSPALRVLLPVGISFYTFQTLSYTIDVYRGSMEPERHFGRFALYVSFFPQLVAGPIERGTNLIPQLRQYHHFDVGRVCEGVQLMFWGLFKKVVIADRLALYVDAVYNNVPNHTGLSYIVATYFFALQIYCDFSGYSDIAIGAARVMGIDLMQNFSRPYFALTIVDFWRRWHISLSTWLRDYLYIPLGGNRKGNRRTYINLMLTMVLGGLWHGANWTFVIWGMLHGGMLCMSKLTLPYRDQLCARLAIPFWLVACIRGVITFHLVCFAWIFFRANTVTDAFHIISHLFSGWPRLFVDPMSMGYSVLGIATLIMVQIIQTRTSIQELLTRRPLAVRWAVYCMVAFSVVLFGVDGDAQFIYFQF